MPVSRNFYDTVADAVRDFAAHGFDSRERLERWLAAIAGAARRSLVPEAKLVDETRAALAAIYRAQVERGLILKRHPGVSAFTLAQVAPRLHAELERRILASAGLIKLNRAAAVEKTLQRFSGWASSVPAGGSRAAEKKVEADSVRKALASLPFEERRVAIDQGFKMVSALSDILANDAGAIAAVWRSHWRQSGYQYREDHKERDGRIFLVRDSWAHTKGLVKPGDDGYVDEIERPSELPFCRCYYHFLYSLDRLPHDMLTRKGVESLKEFTRAA